MAGGQADGSRPAGCGVRRAVAVAALCILALVGALGVAACGTEATRTTLRLIYAGSVIVPFDHLAAAYQTRHPEIEVLTESHGSIQCIRQVTELHRSFDVLVTADYSLIPSMMYSVKREARGGPYATWHLRFATNRMVLAYTEHSRHADELTQDNWYRILAKPGVRWGLADPRFDAAGYRAFMVLQLAERYYGDKTIFEDLTLGRFTTPVVSESDGDDEVIHVPELLATSGDSGVVLRGASIQLLPLLESGDVDYAFEYESVVRQRGLRYLELPQELDLGSVECEDLYRSVSVRLDMQRFASVKPEFQGEVIGYGITIPTTATSPEVAEDFIAFALGRRGRAVFAADHQPLIEPPVADRPGSVPARLAAFLRSD